MHSPYNAAEGDPTASYPVPDVVPRGERDQDELRSEIAHDVTSLPARPLTHEEQEAAEHDVPRGERVYAPASERVPKPPVPGHRDLVEHPDQATLERQATQTESGSPDGTVRHSRGRRRVRVPIGSATREQEDMTTRQLLGFGAGWFGLFVCGAAGMWLYLRWQNERNRPVNRLRRQAHWVADEVRDYVPELDSTDTSTAAIGVAAALLSTGLVLWRRMHAGQEEPKPVDSYGWQQRLTALRERWLPHHVEAEARFSVS
jgi:hypothetical protein